MKRNVLKPPLQFIVYMLLGLIIVGGAGSCKSKKKLAREKAAAEYAAKVSQAKDDLNAMLNGTTNWTLDEKTARLETIKNSNIDDPEVLQLIDKVEDQLAMEKAEAERLAEEERLRKEEEARKLADQEKWSGIENSFKAVAGAPDYSAANQAIQSTLSKFASPDVPVLIIISQAGGFNDYDRPTTIRKYLEYLKDQGTFGNRIENVRYDEDGKITEIELIKN